MGHHGVAGFRVRTGGRPVPAVPGHLAARSRTWGPGGHGGVAREGRTGAVVEARPRGQRHGTDGARFAPRAPEGLHRRGGDGRVHARGLAIPRGLPVPQGARRRDRHAQGPAVAAVFLLPRIRRALHSTVAGAARGVHVGTTAVQVRPRVVLPGHRALRQGQAHRTLDRHAAVLRLQGW